MKADTLNYKKTRSLQPEYYLVLSLRGKILFYVLGIQSKSFLKHRDWKTDSNIYIETQKI